MKSLLLVLSIIGLSGCAIVPSYGTYPEYRYSTPTYIGPTMAIMPQPIIVNPPWYGGYYNGYRGGYRGNYRGWRR